MSWSLKKDTLFDKSYREITHFVPTASDKEKLMIKNGDELIDLIGKFVIGYDEGKKQVSKKLFDQFKRIVDLKADYNIEWEVNKEGELINENGQVVCIFVVSDSIFAKLIKHLPEVYEATQQLVTNLSTTKGLALKTVYNKICDFYDKII